MMKILAADIGGTNSRFAYFDVTSPTEMSMIASKWLQTAKHGSFAELLEGFLDSGVGEEFSNIDMAVFAVAGPIENGVYCRPPNIDWDIDLIAARNRFGMPGGLLVNDFVAQVFACRSPVMNEAEKVLPGNIVYTAPLTAVGAGTGLGIAALVPQGPDRFAAVPSEGGHCAFAFEAETEFELMRFLLAESREPYVRAETVVSGPGLSRIHQFFTGKRLEPADIAAELKADSDTLLWMAAFYGRICRQAALQYLAAGGVYVAGGVAAKIPALVNHAAFGRAFYRSATMAHVLADIPVFLNRNEESGLWGAALCGWQHKNQFSR